MAYTDQNIIDAYNQAMTGGASEADFVSKAQSMGISNDQLASARNTMLGSSTPAPAPNVVSSVMGTTPSYSPAPAQTYSTQNIVDAYNNKGSMSEADFVTGAKTNFGITDDQLTAARNSMLGTPSTGRFTDAQYQGARDWASGKTWAEISQKGSDLGLTAEEMGKVFGNFGGSGQQVQSLTGYGTGFNNGMLADGSKASDWAFDNVKGWVKKPGSRPPGAGGMDMPTTGINLSQLQNASMWEVKPNQTVQDQLQQIIANDSPLMQQARARALQSANSRGLLNSSMAITAGDSALYDAAMPIAQQDASTYADAAKFNTGELNTFSRDNNAFTRDAFMADFNLKANEWAKQQDQYRMYDQLDYQQKLTLDRDAIQNGYQGARDAILNGYTVARDDKTNAFTLQRDTNQNAFTANQAELDRVAAERRTAMGIQAPNPDTSVLRTQMQIDADTAKYNATKVENAKTNLQEQRVNWATRINEINGSDMTEDQKTEAVKTLASAFTPVISSLATTAGLNPVDYIPVQVAAAPAK